jgi:peptidylprolyl isomerase
VAAAASFAFLLTACGSDTDTSSATTSSAEVSTSSVTEPLASSPVPEAPIAASTCPTAALANGGTPEWTLPGTTGNVAVTGSTDTTAPRIDVQAPFSVTETQVQTLKAGDGPVVADTATVSVCYMGVNGRDGTVFDSAYERGTPADFPLDGVVPGFQKAIAGRVYGRCRNDLCRRLPRRSTRRWDSEG